MTSPTVATTAGISVTIPILYEDVDYLVLNKPAGIMVHGDGKNTEPTIADWLADTYPEIREVGEPMTIGQTVIARPGIVHRLDKETSGALLVARNQQAYVRAKKQFQKRTIHKSYRAFIYGTLSSERETLTMPIGRSARDFRRWTTRGIRGETRDATTVVRVLGSLKMAPQAVTYVEAIPLTGRTHQIRVHLRAIGHPVVCDSLYAPGQPALLGFTRLALHATWLEFETVAGKTVRVEAPLPEDFQKAQAKFV